MLLKKQTKNNMKILKFLFVPFILFGITSCKKKENTSVRVYVIDVFTKLNVPNKKITLYEVTKEPSMLHRNYSHRILKEVNTNANGLADFGDAMMVSGSKEQKRKAMMDVQLGIGGVFFVVVVAKIVS